MKKYILFSLLVSTSAMACPELKLVNPRIGEIREALAKKSKAPLDFGGIKYTVEYGQWGDAAKELLDGGFRGYQIHRLEEVPLGECEYKLTDDRTPAAGSFILRAVK